MMKMSSWEYPRILVLKSSVFVYKHLTNVSVAFSSENNPADFVSLVKGSRRLLTYRRLSGSEVTGSMNSKKKDFVTGNRADDLNSFRKRVSAFLICIS